MRKCFNHSGFDTILRLYLLMSLIFRKESGNEMPCHGLALLIQLLQREGEQERKHASLAKSAADQENRENQQDT